MKSTTATLTVAPNIVTCIDTGLAAGQSYTYYVIAKDARGNSSQASNAATLTTKQVDDYGNNTSTAYQLGTLPSYAITTEGNINYGRDLDYFAFTAPSDGMFALWTTGSTGTYGTLYAANGTTTLGENDDNNINNTGGDKNFKMIRPLTAGQVYYIVVSHGQPSGTGAYTLLITKVGIVEAIGLNSYDSYPINCDNYTYSKLIAEQPKIGVPYHPADDKYIIPDNNNNPRKMYFVGYKVRLLQNIYRALGFTISENELETFDSWNTICATRALMASFGNTVWMLNYEDRSNDVGEITWPKLIELINSFYTLCDSDKAARRAAFASAQQAQIDREISNQVTVTVSAVIGKDGILYTTAECGSADNLTIRVLSAGKELVRRTVYNQNRLSTSFNLNPGAYTITAEATKTVNGKPFSKPASKTLMVISEWSGSEDFDTEVRTSESLQCANADIVFSNQNILWHYIGESENSIRVRNMWWLEPLVPEQQEAMRNSADYIKLYTYVPRNNALNLTVDQIAFLILYDYEGAKMYLTAKNNSSLTQQVFAELYNRNPKYYSWIDGSWQASQSWTSTSYSEADVYLTNNGAPLNLVQVVTAGLIVATVAIGAAEIAAFATGVSMFGFRNALTMWSYGTLSATIAFQNGLNGMTNAASLADEIITLPEGTWQKGSTVRGDLIDNARGNNLGHSFPVIDNIQGSTAISIKSLDSAATTYQNGSTLLSKLKSFANQLSNFEGTTYKGVRVYQGEQFTAKSLELVLPDVQLSAAQMQAILDARSYAQSLGLGFRIIVGR